MCSLEVPDIEQAIVEPFAGEELVAWLVNVENSFEEAYAFLDTTATTLPCLLDSDGALYDAYPMDEGYAPFPLHVVIDREGEIVYLARQYDAEATRAAIEAALAE